MPMPNSLRVFLSSTAEDLRHYRSAAAEVIRDAGWIADMMEHFPADPDPILVMCQRRVAECDLFLLLQAFRRGGVPGIAQGGDEETSYTAFELRAADQLHKPVLVFLADENTWPGKLYEDNSVARAWVKDFRNKINRNAKFFGPEDQALKQFKALIREALTHHKERLLNTRADADGERNGVKLTSLRPVVPPNYPDTPYPLLQPYIHPDTFAGRDEELRKLELLLRRPQLILCVYAASGAGKSSLLRAGLAPRLRAAGFPVSVERRPGEPGLAHRIVSDFLIRPASVRLEDDDEDLCSEFAECIAQTATLAGQVPIIILDQLDDYLRRTDVRDQLLARLGPLLAITAQRLPGGEGFGCRWLLCYRHEFHGDVEEWLHDVLKQARRHNRNIGGLPHDLSDGDRCHSWPIPLVGTPQPGEDAFESAATAFLKAILKPAELLRDDLCPRYPLQFTGMGAKGLADAFARARLRQPLAPLVPELQVVLRHLLSGTQAGGLAIIDVPTDPSALDSLIDDALAKHLKQALNEVFRSADPKQAPIGRARALIALAELADEQGRRGDGRPRAELIEILGDGGDAILDRLASPQMRLIFEEERDDNFVCVLAHDRMADVVVRLKRSGGGFLGASRELLEMGTSIKLRSALYKARDDSSLTLTRAQHELIKANLDALVRSDLEHEWWRESDAWFQLVERLRANPSAAFGALMQLVQQESEDWPRLHSRLRSVDVGASVFREGTWGIAAAHEAEHVLNVIERLHPAFLTSEDLFRAMNYAIEEALRRQPIFTSRVEALRRTLTEAWHNENPQHARVTTFRGDAFFLPDETLLGFVEIPAGEFRMGSNRTTDSLARDDESWPHPSGDIGALWLPTFYIARYPVTIAQFSVFGEAQNHRHGYAEGMKRDVDTPYVIVPWYEAVEYCQWLETVLQGATRVVDEALQRLLKEDYHIVLPSEAEWEKAARGADGRIYPWGNAVDPGRANCLEARLGRTSAVGSYLAGASPYGILDMSGNVWEWTRSLYRPYPYDPHDGREDLTADGPRVLRGGSFNRDCQGIRAAVRNSELPTHRGSRIGFRLALSRA